MKVEGNKIYFSSGTAEHAYEGIIGINSNLHAYEGYDAPLCMGSDLSKDDSVELADYMISLWQKFKEKHQGVSHDH